MNRFTSRFHLAAAAIAFLALPLHAATFQVFTSPNFGGASFEFRGETPDVAGIDQGLYNRDASSLLVQDHWEVCTEANYGGQCVIVAPGRYPTLNSPIHRRIGSIRPMAVKQAEEAARNYAAAPPPPVVRGDIRRDPVPAPVPHERARYARGSVDLFSGTDYRGRLVRVERDQPTLEDFTDRASSIVIHEGVWQLCPEPGYRGRCRTFEPGRYPTLRGSVASLRQVR